MIGAQSVLRPSMCVYSLMIEKPKQQASTGVNDVRELVGMCLHVVM